nr:zinc-binding dehydrogenase [Mammaliicoccus sp. Marseille-Q6498]
MKALVLKKGGSINNLKKMEVSTPEIKNDELLIKVHATSLNPSDYQTIEYLDENYRNLILGLDIAGEVIDIGENVKNFKIGDRVFYLRQMENPNGGFAEYSKNPESLTYKIPDNVSYEDAVTLPGAGFTAYYILKNRLKIEKGKNILIHGGSGNLGQFAIQLAQIMKLNIITTASSKNKKMLEEQGLKYIIDYKNQNIEDEIENITNKKGLDYIISSVNSEQATKDLTSLGFNGEIAFVSGFPSFNDLNFYDKSVTIHEIAFGKLFEQQDENVNKMLNDIANNLINLVSQNKINTPNKKLIELEEVPDYLKKLKNNEIQGKIIVNKLN